MRVAQGGKQGGRPEQEAHSLQPRRVVGPAAAHQRWVPVVEEGDSPIERHPDEVEGEPDAENGQDVEGVTQDSGRREVGQKVGRHHVEDRT